MSPRRRTVSALASLGLLLAVTGCSPTLNWRELRPDGSGLVVLFPCRPSSDSRTVAVEGVGLPMTVWVCEVGGSRYALSRLDAGDPARARRAEAALHQAAAQTLGAPAPLPMVQTLGGLRDQPVRRSQLAGRTADGVDVRQQLVTFLVGPVVYQATVFGAKPSEEDVDAFLAGLSLGRRP